MRFSPNLPPDLIRLIVLGLLALVLYGVMSAANLAAIVGLFVAYRTFSLIREAGQSPVTDETWRRFAEGVARRWEQVAPEERAKHAAEFGFDPAASLAWGAEMEVENLKRTYVAPRGRRELTAEFIGLLAFVILIPLAIALFATDLFSLRRPQGWIGALVVAVSVAFYLMPHLLRGHFSSFRLRALWWVLPFVPALFAVLEAIRTDHSYLNPLHPDRRQLAADRVVTLRHNIIAAEHADWVLRYARDLESQGDLVQAAYYYREALRLNADLSDARRRLIEIVPDDAVFAENSPVSSYAPYWSPGTVMLSAPKVPIDAALEELMGCTVILVRVGPVPDAVVNATAHAVREELGLEVLVYENTIPLPAQARRRGLLMNRQWEQGTMVRALHEEVPRLPRAPVRYVLLTAEDIYWGESNFVFSTTYPWGALVSFARYGDPSVPDDRLLHRTAKQTLCALLRSFSIPVSPNRACVTSYSHSLAEFDAKGNRPDAATLALFRKLPCHQKKTATRRPK